MNAISLKIYKRFFEEHLSGVKNYELRFNDRNYQAGDLLILKEIEYDGTYTGRYIYLIILSILSWEELDVKGLQDGYVLLSTTQIHNSTRTEMNFFWHKDKLL